MSSEVAFNDGLDTNLLLSAFCFIVMQHKKAAKSVLQKLRKLKHTTGANVTHDYVFEVNANKEEKKKQVNPLLHCHEANLGGAASNDGFGDILTFSQISLSSTFYKS